MIRRPPRSTQSRSSAASDVYKRQVWSWPRVTTGPDGRFRIGGLAPGEYSVTAAKTGYARETKDVVVADGRGPDPLAFILGLEAVIAGSVRGKRGSGIPDQTVNAMAVDATAR